MNYKISVSPRAQNEIEESYVFYFEKNKTVANNFIVALSETYRILSLNPHFQVIYKNIRAVSINKYPYSLYFVIDESITTVRVLSCFHTSRNPDKLP